jgi:flagellar basal-body rod protein FlgF
MQATEYRQAIMANNVANADTVGFKHDIAIVRERDVASASGPSGMGFRHALLDHMTGGSLVSPTYTTFEQGTAQASANPLDVLIQGNGFFKVQTADGERYTRDGRFTLGPDGVLRTVAGGHPVLNTSGSEIQLDASVPREALTIGSDGTIRQNGEDVGRFGIVDFENKQALAKVGGNLFEAFGAEPQDATGLVRSHMIEGSTVNPVNGITSMIEATRAYQMNASLVQLQNETLGRAVNDIGRIG